MKKLVKKFVVLSTLAFSVIQANAQVTLPEDLKIKPYLDVTYGMFYSDKSYNNPDADEQNYWHEVYAKYGFTGEYQLANSALYGSLMGLSSATFGDGDAAGFSNGKERRTSLEQWTLGWKNSQAEDATLDVSIGRQNVLIGDGFIVAGDALNVGKGIADGELNRGGGYYLAARRSFDFTTVIDFQLAEGLNTHWYYLESGNKAQYQPKLWATDWQYTAGKNDFGVTYLQVIDLDDPLHESVREDLTDIAVRAKTKITEQLGLNGEFVYQEQKHDNENAWYVAASYSFDQLKYQPTVGYRFSSFSENYDPLFYGNTAAGFGTWFQGEVAGNYAGPFNSNARIHQVSLQASVQENLHLGVLAYQFDTIKKDQENLDGHEIDAFAVWSPNKNINVIPLVGLYKPKKDINHLGTQVLNNGSNLYAQLMLQYIY
ncbi:hypothetical protein [Acinetobacter sp.]|uniref:hypothetical protein n=1 Tax=Acinetobacter sp. TaxID=472 RepID=UPI00388E88AC